MDDPAPPPRSLPPRTSSSIYRTPDLSSTDRRYAFSRNASFRHSDPLSPAAAMQRNHSFKPHLYRSDSSIGIPPSEGGDIWKGGESGGEKRTAVEVLLGVVRDVMSGSRPMKRLAVLILMNVAYSTAELMIGLLTGRVGLVSDAFHLTFGCGLLTFSLFAMAMSRKKNDVVYTYGYKRLEVLAAFTNAVFLLFLSFSLLVEALHAFIQDESEHKHYLIVSAVTNLLPIPFVGLILASWLLSLGIENAEVLCMGLVSVAVFMVVMPLFRASGSILLQMAPAGIPTSAFSKCCRQISALEDVSEVSQARFWELVPGHAIGSLSIQVKKGADDKQILQYVHGLYQDLGIEDLTVQTEYL